jgi:hypothetical protein
MRCPICQRDVTEPAPDAPRGAFPFCSDRCKLIDLGRWLGGWYQIPVRELGPNDAETARDEPTDRP